MCIWLKMNPALTAVNAINIFGMNDTGAYGSDNIRVNAAANQIQHDLPATAATGTVAGSTWESPTFLSIVQDYNVTTADTTVTKTYVNGVLKITKTHGTTGRRGGLLATSSNDRDDNIELLITGAAGADASSSCHAGGWACGTGVSPTAAQWLNIYNTYKGM
jgi:hypothetical protein